MGPSIRRWPVCDPATQGEHAEAPSCHQLLAVRPVLEKQPQRLDRRRRLRGRIVQDLEAVDLALILEDADIGLDARRPHVDTGVLGSHGIAGPREHVCDRVCHISQPSSITILRSRFRVQRRSGPGFFERTPRPAS